MSSPRLKLPERSSGVFITGTDTGAGKSVLAAAIVSALRARGIAAGAFKPVITGLDEQPDPRWGHDHELLARTSGCTSRAVVAACYGPAASPHLAAELSGDQPEPLTLVAAAQRALRQHELLVVEGVGGLLVPLADGYDVRRLAREIGLPLLVAARPGLGTINHTLLTLEAACSGGLEVLSVVLTPWPAQPGEVERSNLETIERLGGAPVCVLPEIPSAEPASLAAAGERLPLSRWFGERMKDAAAATNHAAPFS